MLSVYGFFALIYRIIFFVKSISRNFIELDVCLHIFAFMFVCYFPTAILKNKDQNSYDIIASLVWWKPNESKRWLFLDKTRLEIPRNIYKVLWRYPKKHSTYSILFYSKLKKTKLITKFLRKQKVFYVKNLIQKDQNF